MTSKNTDKFTVTVVNRQVNNGETDYIRESGDGSLRIKDSKYYIMYKTDTATVMIRLEGDIVNVKRTGESNSDMTYIAGKTTKFGYNTPYGTMQMEVSTRKLEYSITENGGIIKLQYELCDIENNMEIVIKKR
ncbi:MAG: DUF1934 domain-containing protein [Clostridia bacterium]|nr:DUF1934 domain-containing protein [Clostridia bacterium]